MYNLFEEKIHQRLKNTGHKYLCKQKTFHQVVTISYHPTHKKIPCSRFRTTLGWKLILGWKYIKQSQYTSPVSVKFWKCFIAHVNKSVCDNESWITVQISVKIVSWIFLILILPNIICFCCNFMSSTENHKRKKLYLRPLPSRNVAPGGRTGWIVWGFHATIYRWQHIYQKQVSVFCVTNNNKIYLPVSVERNSRYRNTLGIGNLSLI